MHKHLYMPEDHMDELYNSSNPFVRFVHRNRLKSIVALLPDAKGLKILDAGCGEGHLIEVMHEKRPDNDYYGFDVTEVAVESAKERCPYAKIQQGDIAAMPVPDGSFDVITCTEVLEHIIDYESVVMELKRVLKPGGCLILTFPNEFNWTIGRWLLGRKPVKIIDHVNAFTPRMMRNIVKLPVVAQRSLPFRLPFIASLGVLMKFKRGI